MQSLKAAEDWLCSVVWKDGAFAANGQPPVAVTVESGKKTSVWETGEQYPMPDAKLVTLSFTVCGQQFARKFDIVQNDPPAFVSYASDHERFDALMRHSAEGSSMPGTWRAIRC